MKRKGICLLTALFLTGGIYGCGAEASPEEAILGGWEVIGEDDVTFTFFDDGTMSIGQGGDYSDGTYSITDGKIRFNIDIITTHLKYVCDFELEDDVLTIYDFGDEDYTLQKE